MSGFTSANSEVVLSAGKMLSTDLFSTYNGPAKFFFKLNLDNSRLLPRTKLVVQLNVVLIVELQEPS